MNYFKNRHFFKIIFFFLYFFFLLNVLFPQAPFTEKQIRKYTHVDGLRFYDVTCIDQDKRGNLWIGTKKGISMFNGSSFINYGVNEGLTDERIEAILCDNNNTIWCGTLDGLLFKFDGKKWKQELKLTHSWKHEYYKGPGDGFFLYADKTNSRDKEIWGGSAYIPVFKYSTGKPVYHSFNGTNMSRDSEGNRYIVNGSRLYKIDSQDPQGYLLYTMEHTLTDVIIDNNDTIIISPYSSPLFYSKDSGTSFSEINIEPVLLADLGRSKQELYFMDLFIDKDGNLWGAESKSVFYNYNFYLIKYIKGRINLIGTVGQVCNYIFQDTEGHIWICTAFGLLKVDTIPPFIELIDQIPERILTKEFSFAFRGNDGQFGFSSERLIHSYKFQHENSWKTADKGFVYLSNLAADKEYKLDLRVTDGAGNSAYKEIRFFTDFDETIPIVKIMNKESFENTVDSNDVIFEFMAHDDKSTASEILYSWLLKRDDKVEKNWTPFSGETRARITDLKIGKYTFMVKARDGSGNESEPDKCFFIIEPEVFKPRIKIDKLSYQYFIEYSNRPAIRVRPIENVISSGRIHFTIVPREPQSEKRILEYAILLDPVYNDWSEYVTTNIYELKDIKDGTYTLKVRARADGNFVSNKDEVTFKVSGFGKYPRTEIMNKNSIIRGKWVIIECNASEDGCLFSYSLDNSRWSVFQKSNVISLPVFTNGEHTVRVVSRNNQGIDPSPAEFSFYYEWIPDTPIVNIRSSIPDILRKKNITIEFEAKDDMNTGDKTGSYDLEFSYRLIPNFPDWSRWDRHNSIHYIKLKNGPYFFQVRAKDTAGNVSIVPAEKLFTVNIVPFFRQLWFYILLIISGMSGGIVFSLFYVTGRVKKDIYNQRYNPYIVGEAVHDSEMFFGRDTLIKDIFISLKNNSLCLLGERRIGKTSLLEQLEMNTQPPFFSFYCNLESVKEEYFYRRIMQHLVNKVQSAWKDQSLHLLFFTKEPNEYEDLDFEADLDAILDFLRETYHQEVVIIMCLDEIDATQDFPPSLHQSLRNIFQTYKGTVRMVSAGVSIKRGDWNLPTSPWYNFFEPLEVSGLLDRDAAHLITKPVKGFYSYDQKAIDYILEKTDGKPYYIQTICKKAILKLLDERRRKVTLKDVQAIYESLIYRELNREFEIFWESLSKELQTVVIKAIKGEHIKLPKKLERECYYNNYNYAHRVIKTDKESFEFSTFFRDWIYNTCIKAYVEDVL